MIYILKLRGGYERIQEQPEARLSFASAFLIFLHCLDILSCYNIKTKLLLNVNLNTLMILFAITGQNKLCTVVPQTFLWVGLYSVWMDGCMQCAPLQDTMDSSQTKLRWRRMERQREEYGSRV